jgi:hypothetical protein
VLLCEGVRRVSVAVDKQTKLQVPTLEMSNDKAFQKKKKKKAEKMNLIPYFGFILILKQIQQPLGGVSNLTMWRTKLEAQQKEEHFTSQGNLFLLQI